MLDQLKAAIARQALIARGDRVLVACSGGPDSLALLHGLWRLQDELEFEVAAAHLDHGFRGAESRAEAQFVEAFCRERGIRCWSEAVNMPDILRREGLSSQDGSRRERYAFLRRVAAAWPASSIATGHQLEDQAETLLLHLLRGAGPNGLAAMSEKSADLIRPLLGISRVAIEAYCIEQRLVPRRDSSNAKTDYSRNRLRLDVMPLLRSFNPALPQALGRTAQLLAEQRQFMREQANAAFAQLASWQNETLELDAAGLAKLHVALQREIFRLALEKKRGQLTGITFDHVETLIKMHCLPVGSRMELPNGLQARRTYRAVLLEARSQAPQLSGLADPQPLAVPGVLEIPELGVSLTAELFDATVPESESADSVVIDVEALQGELFVRTRRNGDRFAPVGLGGSKKVKEFFIDEKIPRELRDAIPLVCDAAGIIWIAGYRKSERASAGSGRRKCIRLTIHRKQEEPTCIMM